jgi:hypothetical protein
MQCSECLASNTAEFCCICELPLKTLCQEHAKSHSQSQDFHFLLPMSAAGRVNDLGSFYEARSWLLKLKDRQAALLKQVSLVSGYSTQLQEAYQALARQLYEVVANYTSQLEILHDSLQTQVEIAVQETSEHALETNWLPGSHFAEVLWTSEAAQIASIPLVSFSAEIHQQILQETLSVSLSCDVPGCELYATCTTEESAQDQRMHLNQRLENAKALLKTWFKQVEMNRTERAMMLEVFGTEIDLPPMQDFSVFPDFSTINSRATLKRTGYYKAKNDAARLVQKPPVKLENGDYYEGQWDMQNNRCGIGTQIRPNGDEYRGVWRDGKRHGKGQLILGSGDIYEGDFENDKYHGFGVYQSYGGIKYRGEFRDGKRSGIGKLEYPEPAESVCYLGEFKADMKEGLGAYLWRSGAVYLGNWQEDFKHGLCIEGRMGSPAKMKRYLRGDEEGCPLQ